ncbi:MAG: polyprenol monophosphomannose synthase [Patescibacteria group bacterium]
MGNENLVIIVPTYNEILNLSTLLLRIAQIKIPLTLLIVDDNSPDGTGELATKLKKQYPFVNVLSRKEKQGLGSAYRAGFAWALEKGAEVVGEMDADLSHQPEDLPKLIQAIKDGADVAIGSRRIPGGKIIGWSWWRHFTSWSAMALARLILNLKTKDITSGFRLYTKQSLQKIPWATVKSSGYAWQEELVYLCEKNNLKIVEVPITFIDRKFGKSKLHLKDVLEYFKTLWCLKFNNK